MKNKKLFYLFLSISIFLFIVIMALSLTDGTKSSDQSSNFTSAITPILPPIPSVDSSTGDIVYNKTFYFSEEFKAFVRKLFGHYGLFVAFSLSVNLTFLQTKIKISYFLISSFLIGLFVASLSEFAQLFTPLRGASIKDVGIDFLGYITCLFFFAMYYLLDRFSTGDSKNEIK